MTPCVYQVLQGAHKGGAQAALVQVFSITQVDDLVDQLKKTEPNVRKVFQLCGIKTNPRWTPHLAVDHLQHDVLRFQVSVDDLVGVQILDPRAWSRGEL